ncbi:hypothetical protein C7B61_12275, partial [filamentous cyanobacterium CCP1]
MNKPLQLIQPNPNVAATFIGNAGVSTDGLGTNSTGIIQAEIPAGSRVEFAFLHIATRTFDSAFRPAAIGFEGESVPITFLDNVGDPAGELNFETGRANVTSIVSNKVGRGGGIFDFTVDETITGSPELVEGTSLTVIYSNRSLPERTIVVLEGGLTGETPQSNILSLGSPIDKTNPNFIARMALGIQYGFPNPRGQFSTVDINGTRLTSSAGGFDDSSVNRPDDGNLITVGGIGDSFSNPIDRFSNDLSLDDELYDLAPFLQTDDTAIRIDTANPSNDDSIFLAVLTLPGVVTVDQPIQDNAGDTLGAARDLSVLIGTQILNDFVGGVDANDYYRFEVTQDSQFSLTLSGLNSNARAAILDARGTPITTISADRNNNGVINLDLSSGQYYVRIFRPEAALTPYNLELAATPVPPPFQIRQVTPNQGSNTGQSTITIVGNQFTPNATVQLIDSVGGERTATRVTWLNSETLSATFELSNSAADTYDVRVIDTAGTATAENAFGVRIGTIGQVEVYLSAPSRIRSFGTDVVTITYRNTGDSDVVAPLLSLEATGALLQPTREQDFTESQIQLLGINNQGLAGVLPAGATGRFTVRFQPTVQAGNQVNFSVKALAENEPIDW